MLDNSFLVRFFIIGLAAAPQRRSDRGTWQASFARRFRAAVRARRQRQGRRPDFIHKAKFHGAAGIDPMFPRPSWRGFSSSGFPGFT